MIQKLISGGQEVNLSSFSASCFGYKIEAAKLTPNTYQAANDLVSTYVSTKEGDYLLSVDFLVETEDAESTDDAVFRLKEALLKFEAVFSDAPGRTCEGVLTNYTITKLLPNTAVLNAVSYATIWGAEETVAVTAQTQEIAVDSPKETYLTIQAAALEDLPDGLALSGIEVGPLTTGEALVINGEKRTVKINGVNAFDRVKLIDFPTASKVFLAEVSAPEKAEVKVSYRKRW